MDICTKDLVWLAGLSEAEGSFMAGPPSAPRQPRFVICMTDEDIVQRCADIFNLSMTSYQRPPKGDVTYKKSYTVRLVGLRAYKLMKTMQPLMSQRRQTQITKACEAIDAGEYRRKKLTTFQAAEIKQLKQGGVSATDLSQTYDISVQYVYELCQEDYRKETAVVQPMDITLFDEDTYRDMWLAGWLEGEGTFAIKQNRHFVIEGVCTDKDVIMRIKKWKGSSTSFSIPKNSIHSNIWSMQITGTTALETTYAVYPYLGSRRQTKILEQLERVHQHQLYLLSKIDQKIALYEKAVALLATKEKTKTNYGTICQVVGIDWKTLYRIRDDNYVDQLRVNRQNQKEQCDRIHCWIDSKKKEADTLFDVSTS